MSSALLVLSLALSACNGGSVAGGGGEFTVDSYPTLVNSTPVTVTGTKPSGHAVAVDDVVELAADSLTSWTIELELAEGDNSFVFSDQDPAGQTGQTVAVEITLDSVAPTVLTRSPPADAVDISLNAYVTATFSEPVNCATVTSASFSLLQGSSPVSAALVCSAGDPVVRLTPDANLQADTLYTVMVLSDIADPAGNPLESDANWQFTTGTQVVQVCGDSIPQTGEECDDGANGDPCDGCLDDCTIHVSTCGDSYACAGEQCDDGNADPCDGCLSDCTTHTNTCGDTQVCGNEQCDDANLDPCDGCLSDCTTHSNFCGDGYPCDGEECDDGGNLDGDGCSATCTNEGSATCGDGIPQAGEQCDDGANGDDCDGCLDDCTIYNNTCGDQIPCPGEDCDDGANGDPCDGCLDDCISHINTCGDGHQCDAEECDDNNTDDGDGCSSTCLLECQLTEPTVDPVVSPTSAVQQAITGGKPANTAILINDSVAVPQNNSTTWDAEVDLTPGLNNLEIKTRDQSGQESCPVAVAIDYNEPSFASSGGEVKINLEVISAWNYVGDEFRLGSRDRPIFDAYSVQVWIEGPLAHDDQGNSDPSDDQLERCLFDQANYQRKYTRYVKTVKRHIYEGCIANNPSNYQTMCPGYWWEPNFWAPNWQAALIEAGLWANAAYPIPPDLDRRDNAGHTWWPPPNPTAADCPPTFRWNSGNCKPRMQEVPTPIDGITEATVSPHHDGWNYPFPATTGTGAGSEVGEWTDDRQYSWNLRDADGNLVRQGAYLVSISIVLDRALMANPHWLDAKASDYETCWDNTSHTNTGMHRAEGIIIVGPNPQTIYLQEEGAEEYVDNCSSPNLNICCNGHIDFSLTNNCSTSYTTPTQPCSLTGQRVRHFNPARFLDPIGNGQDYAVKLEYCPGGCP